MKYRYCFRQGLVERRWDITARDTTLGATAFTSYCKGIRRDVIINDSSRLANWKEKGTSILVTSYFAHTV